MNWLLSDTYNAASVASTRSSLAQSSLDSACVSKSFAQLFLTELALSLSLARSLQKLLAPMI